MVRAIEGKTNLDRVQYQRTRSIEEKKILDNESERMLFQEH
jgi:hypothetical protein